MKTHKERQEELLKEIKLIKNNIRVAGETKVETKWLFETREKATEHKKEVEKGCGKKMRNSRNKGVEEYYSCGDAVQTGWGGGGYIAGCKDCREVFNKYEELGI